MESSSREHTSLNFNYHQDIRFVFTPTNWILGSIGIWPLSFRGVGRHVSNIVLVLCNATLVFVLVPCVLHVIYDEKDMKIRLKHLGLVGFCLTVLMKYFLFAIRRPKILHCIQHVKDDWLQVKINANREVMLKFAGTGRKLSIISASAMYAAGFIYNLILPFCIQHKVDNRTMKPQVYATYSEFGQIQASPMYEVVFFVHCVSGYTMYSITIGTCGLAAMFATHACGQIGVIASRLNDLANDSDYEQEFVISKSMDKQRIGAIVKGYVRVIEFAAVVEEVLQEVCLVEFSSSMCTICLLEYDCITDWQENDRVGLITYAMLFVSFCFNLFLLCYIGELLMEKSSEMGMICYMINWYKLTPTTARSLILIMAMSNHPIKITAGGMVDLSLMTFGNVLKTSLAYLSFLRTSVIEM